MKVVFLSLLILLIASCATNRSISYYQAGYNPSYRGEMSQQSFIKEVSDPNSTKSNDSFVLSAEKRIMIIQSGQSQPDKSMIDTFSPHCTIIPMAGTIDNPGPVSLREAALAGDIDYIIAYWGSITTTLDKNIYVRLSIIVSDPHTGRWQHYIAKSSEQKQKSTIWFNDRTENTQVEDLKLEAYQNFLNILR